MRTPAAFPIRVLSLLLAGSLLGACDQIANLNKPAEPAPAPAEVAAPPPAPAPAPVAAVDLEAKSHLKQGFAFIVTAKNARDDTNRMENLNNALNEFSQAIEKAPGYAEAYSNRAVAYMQLRKFNKAQEDLDKAKQLAPDSAGIRYNLASLYALKGDVDLALDEVDAALARGFQDYDALRADPDLDNARRHPEFRKILEKHKVFIMN